MSDDLMELGVADEGAAANELPAAVKVARRSAFVDMAKGEYVLDGVTYSYGAMPEASARYCGLMGLARVLAAAADPIAAFGALLGGKVPATRGRASGERELDPWRRAFVKALLAKVNPKKGPAVMTEADAEGRARALTAADMRAIKMDPDVVRARRGLVESDPTPLEAAVAATRPQE